jgi:coenzyme F420-reducing hydrogenase gamma subunit
MAQSVGVQLVSWPESKVAIGTCAMLGAVVGGFNYAGQLIGDPTSQEEKRKRFFKNPPKPLIEIDAAQR